MILRIYLYHLGVFSRGQATVHLAVSVGKSVRPSEIFLKLQAVSALLIKKQMPKIFIDVMIAWYDGLYCRVLWDGHYSSWFNVSAGVRQEGILSPDFYSLYIDDLFRILESSGIGCYLVHTFAAILTPVRILLSQ